MATAAGWYDEAGRQLLVAEVSTARACFYIGEAVGLLTDWAVSPSSPSTILRPQWSPVRAVLSVPIPPVRSYGEGWQVEVLGDPSQSAGLSFRLNGEQHTINLAALSAPPPVAVSYGVLDTMFFRNSPAQLLRLTVNGDYPSGGFELPRALMDADYYSVDDRNSTYLWFIDEGRYMRAYNRQSREEVAVDTPVADSFNLFIAGHLF